MPCAEVVNAIAWSKKSNPQQLFPVVAYFTKHFGTAATAASKDTVHYASGQVFASDTPTPHLKGTLNVAKNAAGSGQMVSDTNLTYDVEIYPDGTLSYLMKLKGQPVGGMPATTVQATCVNDALLTAIHGSEVVAVGVAREPLQSAGPS